MPSVMKVASKSKTVGFCKLGYFMASPIVQLYSKGREYAGDTGYQTSDQINNHPNNMGHKVY